MILSGRTIPPELLLDLLGNTAVEIEPILRRIKRFQQHEILKERPVFGEYHHLFPLLRRHPEKFYQYTRMEVSTFDYILDKVAPFCQKKWCNFHKSPIRAEERLVMTLRYLVSIFGNSLFCGQSCQNCVIFSVETNFSAVEIE